MFQINTQKKKNNPKKQFFATVLWLYQVSLPKNQSILNWPQGSTLAVAQEPLHQGERTFAVSSGWGQRYLQAPATPTQTCAYTCAHTPAHAHTRTHTSARTHTHTHLHDTPVPINTANDQILDSKPYSPLKGSRTSWRNSQFQAWEK